MKIDQDLRAAIRSATKSQPDSFEVRQAAETQAINDLFKKKPFLQTRFERARSLRQQSTKLRVEAEKLEASIGVYQCGTRLRIAGTTAFVRNGGRKKNTCGPWKFDEAMAELAAAEPKQLTAILKKYGINWK